MTRIGCAHCGLPVRGGGSGPRFCCTGCALVASLGPGTDEDSPTPAADRWLSRVVLGAFLSMGVMVASLALYGEDLAPDGSFTDEGAQALRGLVRSAALLLCVPILFGIGLPLARGVRVQGRLLTVDGLVVLGAGAAFGMSVWNTITGRGEVYFETVAMVLVLVGLARWLDVHTKERAWEHVRELARAVEVPATRLRDGREDSVAVQDLERGDRVLVRAGQTIPCDGVVVHGGALVDAADLTGESRPRRAHVGDLVLAGTRPVDGALQVVARAVGAERVREAVERTLASALQSGAQRVGMADALARWILPIALVLGVGSGIFHGLQHGLEHGLLVGLSVVLIACPCALSIATPLAFWTALGRAWEQGVLVRGGDVLERIANVSRIWFDKTGTLTGSEMELVSVEVFAGFEREDVMTWAVSLEQGSAHPIARCLRDAHRGDVRPTENFQVLPGRGVRGVVDGTAFELRREDRDDGEQPTTPVVLVAGTEVLARFDLAVRPRPRTRELFAELRKSGYDLQVLTGDANGPARALEDQLAVDVRARLLPADKVTAIEDAGAEGTLFVGDGLNDGPALAVAGVGVAVRDGAPHTAARADVLLMVDDLEVLPELLTLARRTSSVARGNLVWASVWNAAGLALATTGHLPPIVAALAMVVSSAMVVGHTHLRLARPRTPSANVGATPQALGRWKTSTGTEL